MAQLVGGYPKLHALGSVEAFRQRLGELGVELPCDATIEAAPESPLARPLPLFGRTAGNRFAVQPMEGWDGTADGRPTETVVRRWRRFGESGAKLIWGGEAAAVRHDGRANPRQLVMAAHTQAEIAALRGELVAAHRAAFGSANDLLIGLQLTHSGRFSRPDGVSAPRIAFRHPLLDRRVGVGPDYPVLSDGEIRRLVDDFVVAAVRASKCGFDFVDVKHCHGYLGHELLGAHTREGSYGGTLENRTRFLREVVEGIRTEAPCLGIGVRVSAFDLVPFHPDPAQSTPGRPGPGVFEDYCDAMPYRYGFGVDPEQPTEIDLSETVELVTMLRAIGIGAVNVTGGSPYYNPHIQRPALYPPSDGYLPPEDPLVGVARHLYAARHLKSVFPDLPMVGTGYSYLQEFLPNVAQAAVREGWIDAVGLGRMVLAYPELPRDVLSGAPLQRKRLCRTFSDCTTAPRNGLISGCYPLDPFYRRSPEAEELRRVKSGA